jgi:hypothetical protein
MKKTKGLFRAKRPGEKQKMQGVPGRGRKIWIAVTMKVRLPNKLCVNLVFTKLPVQNCAIDS